MTGKIINRMIGYCVTSDKNGVILWLYFYCRFLKEMRLNKEIYVIIDIRKI